MKINILYTAVLIIMSILWAGCERNIDFKGEDNEPENIALTVAASPDTTLEVMAGRTFLFTRLAEVTADPEYVFNISASLRFGHVYYSINGCEPVEMTYDDEHHRFSCDYLPKVGDRIEVTASSTDLPTVSGFTTIPERPSLEVISSKIIRSETEEGRSKAEIKLRLVNDPAATLNYYRLMVKNFNKDDEEKLRDKTKRTEENYNYVYTSDDAIFKDTDIYAERGGWQRCFSDVFSDRLFNGVSREFTVTTELVGKPENVRMVVELQSITEDLYIYLKSLMLYSITPQDEYTEAIQIYSNVKDGWGIVGAVNTDRHVIEF